MICFVQEKGLKEIYEECTRGKWDQRVAQELRVFCLKAKDPGERKVWKAHPLSDQAFSIFRPVDCTLKVIIHTNGLSKQEALDDRNPAHLIPVVVGPDEMLVVIGKVWLENVSEGIPMVIWQGFSVKDRRITDPDGTADFMDVTADTPEDLERQPTS